MSASGAEGDGGLPGAPWKLVLAIVQDDDAAAAIQALTGAGIRVTRINTAGGFLRKGNATLLMGVAPEQVAVVTRVLRETCRTRLELATPTGLEGMAGLLAPIEVQVGGATIFVLDVREYQRL